MIQIIRQVDADVVKRGATRAVYAKQNDLNSRFLNVSIQEDGKQLVVEPTAQVILNVERPDKLENMFYGTVNEDGSVRVPLTSWMLELAGTLLCDISIVQEGVAKLTTMQFNIYIEEAVVSDASFMETEDYSVIVDLLNRTTEAEKLAADAAKNAVLLKENCEKATESAIEAAADATKVREEVEAGGFIKTIKESNKGTKLSFWLGTQAEYDALSPKVNNCCYIITDESNKVIMGDVEVTGLVDIDYTFSPTSANPQSGIAVAQAVSMISDLRNLYDGVAWSEGNHTLVNGEVVFQEATGYASYRVSDYIPVNPGPYTCNHLDTVAFYDENKVYMYSSWSKQFTVPANARYLRIGVRFKPPTTTTKELYLLRGIHESRPDDINVIDIDKLQVKTKNIKCRNVTGENIGFNEITPDNLSFVKSNIDYVKGVSFTDNTSINQYGVVQEFASFSLSDFISVKSNTEYVFTYSANSSVVAFTDEKVPIGGITLTNRTFTTPENCCYIRFSQQTSKLPQVKLFETSADQTKPNTFTLEGLLVGKGNLDSDVLASVKAPLSSILADLIFTSETKNIKLIGDSITHGMCSSDFAQSTNEEDFLFNAGAFPQYRNYGVKCWAGMLKTYLESKFNCTVTNNGASGASAQQLVDNWDAIVSADDDIIICMIGTNDRNKTLASIYQSVTTLYEKAQTNNQRIIFMSAPPTSIENENQFTSCHMEDIDNLYNYVNNAFDVGYISIYKAFLNYCREHNITIDSLLADGLHPNDTGYQLMFEIVLEALGFGRKRDGATW